MKLLNLKLIYLSFITCLVALSGCGKSADKAAADTASTSSDTSSDSSSSNDTTAMQYSFPSLLSVVTTTMPATFFASTASSDPSGGTDFPFSTNVRNNFFKDPDNTTSTVNLIKILGMIDAYTTLLNANQTAAAACLQADGTEYSVTLPKIGTAAAATTNGTGVGLAAGWTAAGSTTTMSLPHYKVFAGCRAIINSTASTYEFIQIGKGTPGSKEIKFLHWQNQTAKAIIMVSPSDNDASKMVIDGIITVQSPYYTGSTLNWDYVATGTTAGSNLALTSNTLGATSGVFNATKANAVIQFRADEDAGVFQMTAAGLNTGVCGVQLVANQSSYFVQGAVETLATAPTESSSVYTLTSNCAVTKPSFAGSAAALDTASTSGLGSSDYTLYDATVGGFARASNDKFNLNAARILSYAASSANTFGTGIGPNLNIATDGQNTAADLTATPGTPKKFGIVYLLGLGDTTTTPASPAAADITDVSDMLAQ